MSQKITSLIILAVLLVPFSLVVALDLNCVTPSGFTFTIPNDGTTPCPTIPPNSTPCVGTGCAGATIANAITIGGGLNPSGENALAGIVARITKYLLYIALVVAPLAVLMGGLMIFFAAGETDKVTTGRNIIIWALVGLAIFLAAKILSNIIITAVTT